MLANKALFLDRDGVINVDYGYVYRPDQVDFVDGIFDLCRYAYELNFKIFVITNQAGIGRGYYTEDDFYQLMAWIQKIFMSRGCPIEKVYFCPYHPTAGVGHYRRDANCRKPKPGMILAAAKDFNLNLDSSVLVGDRFTDIAAGQAAGVKFNLLYSAYRNLPATKIIPTAYVEKLSDILPYIRVCAYAPTSRNE